MKNLMTILGGNGEQFRRASRPDEIGSRRRRGSFRGPADGAAAQRGEARAAIAPGAMRAPGEIAPFTGPAYKNDYGRFKQNGPMDDTTRKIVKFVHDFNQSNMSAATIKEVNRTMIDSMAAIVAGFEEDAVPHCGSSCDAFGAPEVPNATVLGYGLSATPELATFANCCLIRADGF